VEKRIAGKTGGDLAVSVDLQRLYDSAEWHCNGSLSSSIYIYITHIDNKPPHIAEERKRKKKKEILGLSKM